MSKKDNHFKWNDGISLKEYFEKLMAELIRANDQRFNDLEEKLQVIFDKNEIALQKSDIKLDARLSLMNEFRSQMKDQAATFVTRNELKMCVEKIDMSIRNLEISKAALEGKASAQALMFTQIMTFISLLIGLVALIFKI